MRCAWTRRTLVAALILPGCMLPAAGCRSKPKPVPVVLPTNQTPAVLYVTTMWPERNYRPGAEVGDRQSPSAEEASAFYYRLWLAKEEILKDTPESFAQAKRILEFLRDSGIALEQNNIKRLLRLVEFGPQRTDFVSIVRPPPVVAVAPETVPEEKSEGLPDKS